MTRGIHEPRPLVPVWDKRNMICPNKDCDEIIRMEAGCFGMKSKKVVCNVCMRPACTKCRQHWHEGTTCGDNLDAGIWSILNVSYTRSCPNCKSRFNVMNQGVDAQVLLPHIMCYRCEYKYCFNCLASIKNHQKGCINDCTSMSYYGHFQ